MSVNSVTVISRSYIGCCPRHGKIGVFHSALVVKPSPIGGKRLGARAMTRRLFKVEFLFSASAAVAGLVRPAGLESALLDYLA